MMTSDQAGFSHIAATSTWDSGGGQELDILDLKDGKVLVISDDAIVLYDSRQDFEETEARERPTIYR